MLFTMRIKGSRLSSGQLTKLLEFFVAGTTARTAAELTGVNRNSANLFYNKLRRIIVHFTGLESPFLDGEVEVDESYFRGVRKGQRGRGERGKRVIDHVPHGHWKTITFLAALRHDGLTAPIHISPRTFVV